MKTTQLPFCSFKLLDLLKEKGCDLSEYFGFITHATAIQWIKDNFQIQLFPDYKYYGHFLYGYHWVDSKGSYGELWVFNNLEPDGCNTIEEATEYALLFTLNNLI